ncbi:MAG: hypothetical protein Q8L75_05365 [Acidobacteriota bacterium]|nr:hypothetical protein [Acidobacteriota bacterium]
MQHLDAPWRAEFKAEDLVAELFSAHDWKVQRQLDIGPYEPDFLVKRGRQAFVVEVKAHSEGRGDRVIPLLSHAILQARAYAAALKVPPMAVVYVRDASPSLVSQVGLFAKDYANDVAIGIVSEAGLRFFVGEGLEDMNLSAHMVRVSPSRSAGRAPNLFSDLNQWMLKVLLAPEIDERLLSAPRGRYRNVSDLAKAADVSVMSAFRFHEQLREAGFVDESSPYLNLVRRAELFRRWQAESRRAMPREVPMRFLIRGSVEPQLHQFVSSHESCLALFAAADALKLGHVKGVLPYVYVAKLSDVELRSWSGLAAVVPGERPDVIVRKASVPKSVFRGMVDERDVACCDVLQVWLDVAAHPSRGEEQAELIYRKVLRPVVEGAGK